MKNEIMVEKTEIESADLELLKLIEQDKKDMNAFVKSLGRVDNLFNIFDDSNNEKLYSLVSEGEPSDEEIKLCFDNRVLNKGVVKFETISSNGTELAYFKFIDNKLMMYSMLTMTVTFVIEENGEYIFKFIPLMDEIAQKLDTFKDIIFNVSYITLKIINKFTNLCLNPIEEIKVLDIKRNLQNNKNKKKKTVLKKYTINLDNYKKYVYETSNTVGRKNQRHTEAWEVRGHWRTYKSGKRVWVRPSVKGDKSKLVKKQTYECKGE